MPRKRTVTARKTTTVTEEITATETVDTMPVSVCYDDPDIPWVTGWGEGPDLLAQRHAYLQQREEQWRRCLEFWWDTVRSAEMTAAQTGSWDSFAHQLPDLMRSAKVILRAGPGATPAELYLGRSI